MGPWPGSARASRQGCPSGSGKPDVRVRGTEVHVYHRSSLRDYGEGRGVAERLQEGRRGFQPTDLVRMLKSDAHPVPATATRRGRRRQRGPAAARARGRCGSASAARSNSARASSSRPSFSSRSPRTPAAGGSAFRAGSSQQRVDQLQAGRRADTPSPPRPRGSAPPPATASSRGQRVVERRDPRPVRLRRRAGARVAGRDRRLQRVRPAAPRPAPRPARAPPARGGSAAGPSAAILVQQQDRLAARPDPRPRPRRLDLHQRDQAVHLRLSRRQPGQDAAEPQRILAERRPHPVVAGRRRVALVEDQVDAPPAPMPAARPARRRAAPRTAPAPRPASAWPARSAGRPSALRPGTPARSRRWSGRRAAAASAPTRASVERTGWQAMKISRSRSSPTSSSSAGVQVVRSAASCSTLELAADAPRASAPARVVPPKLVDGAVLGGGHQPGARVVRDARLRPLLQRRDQRVLRQLLGQPDVAHEARQPGDQPGDSIRQTASIGAVGLGSHDHARASDSSTDHGGQQCQRQHPHRERERATRASSPLTPGGWRRHADYACFSIWARSRSSCSRSSGVNSAAEVLGLEDLPDLDLRRRHPSDWGSA